MQYGIADKESPTVCCVVSVRIHFADQGFLLQNAMLIVEFGADQHEAGLSVFDAAIEAARLRFRPIVMLAGVHSRRIAAGELD